MMMRQDSNPTTTNPTVCGQCGVEERKLLHNVRLRGNFRRLCTNCVLRLHPQCFCPACLGVYERAPPDDAVVCYKCYSSSHPNCVISPPAGTITSARGPSPCSSCLNPSSLVLSLKRLENGNRNGSRVIDSNAARLLLAAGKIASMSMNKAEIAAAMEAERRAKEAAFTKKRAREALDHVVKLMAKENRNAVIEGNKKIGNVSNSVVIVNNKIDASNEVLEALNAVELKELAVVPVDNVVPEEQGSGGVVMEVDIVDGKNSEVNPVTENGSVKNDDLEKVVQGEKTCNDLSAASSPKH